MDTPQQTPRIVETFICYRRDDASLAGEWLFKLLDGHEFEDRQGNRCKLGVFFDQAEPGVGDWKAHLEPALQSARAFIVLCSHGLATNFSKGGTEDWAHREIDWWLDNRGAPPIVVNLTGDERWIPERIRNQWPNLNRQKIDPEELRRSAPDLGSELAQRIRKWVVATVIESANATIHEDLDRARKRNKYLVFATAVAAMGCVMASIQWWRADRALEVAESQRSATRESMGFMAQLFSRADPDGLLGESPAARQLLKVAPSTIANQSSPLLKAHLLRILGGVYTGLANSGEAVEVLKTANEYVKSGKGQDDDLFRMEYSLGEAYLYTEDLSPALEHLDKAYSLSRSPGVSKSERAYSSMLMGDFYAWSKKPDRERAANFYQEALAIDSTEPINQMARARDLNRLGNLALDELHTAEARRNFQAAVDATEEFPDGVNPLFKAQYEHDLAGALYNDGAFDQAFARFNLSSESFRKAYGDESIEYGVAENNVARMLLELDRLPEATPRIARAVEVETKAAGPHYSGLALAMNTHAITLRAAGAMPEARKQFEQALVVANDSEMPVAAQILTHLAELDLDAKDAESARDRLKAANDNFTAFEAAEGWRYALYENALGELRVMDCQLKDARTLLERSSDVMKKRWPGGNLFTRAAQARAQTLEHAEQGGLCAGKTGGA